MLILRLLLVLCSAPTIAELTKTAKCPAGEHWVSAHSRRAYYRADGTFVKASNVKAHCRKNPLSYEYWYPKLKPGLPEKWFRQNENTKPWTTEEMERVLETLESIPEFLWVDRIEGIYRLQKDASGHPNPAASSDGKIVLYDLAFDKKFNLAQVLAHEMSHEFFKTLTLSEFKAYAEAGEWISQELFNQVIYMRGRPKNAFVQEDGRYRIDEDFCNNIEYFLFKPEELKKTTPKVYEWIKKKYGDKLRLRKGSHL